MFQLVYTMRSLTEDKFSVSGGGSVRISSLDLAKALQDAGVKAGGPMGEYLRGEKEIPLSALDAVKQHGGRVSGVPSERAARSSSGPRAPREPTTKALLKTAYAVARKEFKSYDDAGWIWDHYEPGQSEADVFDFLQSAAADLAQGVIQTAPEIQKAYHALPVKQPYGDWDTPTRATFIDILSDMAAEHMFNGFDKWKKQKAERDKKQNR